MKLNRFATKGHVTVREDEVKKRKRNRQRTGRTGDKEDGSADPHMEQFCSRCGDRKVAVTIRV